MRREHISILIIALMFSILFAFLIVNSDTGISGTTYWEGHITSDDVWNATKSPIFIEGNVTVDPGVNLTIEPGVEVRFDGFYNLYIEGNLIAVGNESNMIRFTSNESSPSEPYWVSVQINASGSAEIKYCDISYAYYGISISDSPSNKNIIVQYNNISNSWIGVRLYYSSNNTILSNNISDNFNHGIFLSHSSENIVKNNELSNNGRLSLGNGVHLHYSSDNNIQNNDICYNNYRGMYLFWSESNEMKYNRIISNLYDGIYITQSSDNEFRNNNISLNGNNGGSGINLTVTAQNNRIFHNTLIDNVNQATDATNNSNQWDGDYPTGGNYWSDYTGVDFKRGENQDVPGSDGLGDSPYIIDSDSEDRYPLMNMSRNIAPFLFALLSPLNESVIKPGTIIDLHILVEDFNEVNYSLNGTGDFNLTEPFDVNTSSWSEGYNRIDLYVNDTSGNVNSSWFSFTVDATKPIIDLISPQNNSVIRAGDIINISILELHIKYVSNITNNGTEQSLLYPYDLDTSSWPDGNYSIIFYVEDLAGNNNSELYVFTVDSTPPLITLNYPTNNSYIRRGVSIDISISDEHLNTSTINFSIDGQGPNIFDSPYIINTDSLEDGNYEIEVNAIDLLGNLNSTFFNITIDSIAPTVILNHPLNNSAIIIGTTINFSIFDLNPFKVRYSMESNGDFPLLPPYDINTSSSSDGNYHVLINATDSAGNSNITWYNITIDSNEPIINLVSLKNNSRIKGGTEIVFIVFDPTLAFANYSVNGGEYQSLLPSLKIDTTNWPDGTHNIQVYAVDLVGNNLTKSYNFYIDNTPPEVVSTKPKNNKDSVPLDSTISIKFDEQMDFASVIYAFKISPEINFTVELGEDNVSIIIIPISDLLNDTEYKVVINTSARDLVGNNLEKDHIFTFSTGVIQKDDWTWLLLIAIVVVVLVIILSAYLMARRKLRAKEEEAREEDDFEIGLEEDEKGGEIKEELEEKELEGKKPQEDLIGEEIEEDLEESELEDGLEEEPDEES